MPPASTGRRAIHRPDVVIVVGAGVARAGRGAGPGPAGHDGGPGRARRHPAARGPRRGVRVGPPRRPAGAPLARVPGPAAQPAARRLPRRARRRCSCRAPPRCASPPCSRRTCRSLAHAGRRGPRGHRLSAHHVRVGAAPRRARRGRRAGSRRSGRPALLAPSAARPDTRRGHRGVRPGAGGRHPGRGRHRGRRRVGRGSAVPRSAGAVGATVTEDGARTPASSTCRASSGCSMGPRPPRSNGPIGGDLGYLKYGVFQGDNRTFSVTLAVADRRRRAAQPPARPDHASTRAAGALPATAAWVEPERAEPHHRGARHGRAASTARRLRARRPPARGRVPRGGRRPHLHQPALRARLQLAMVQAALLADRLAEHHGRPRRPCAGVRGGERRRDPPVVPGRGGAGPHDRPERTVRRLRPTSEDRSAVDEDGEPGRP